MKKPMVDIAFDLMSKKKNPVLFLKLWEEVAQIDGLTPQQADDNIAQFYMDLGLDNRFVHMGENKWDLRSRHTFNEVVVDTDALIIDENDGEEDELELLDEEEEKDEIVEDKY